VSTADFAGGSSPVVGPYRGRLAPSPTGFLHLGHAATFWAAQGRALAAGGSLILRVEDLDVARCKQAFAAALLEDLAWIGLRWDEGPDVGGPYGPYRQLERLPFYRAAWQQLASRGAIYACRCTRRDVAEALTAPHDAKARRAPVPDPCRPREPIPLPQASSGGTNWRFRVPAGKPVNFHDGNAGAQCYIAGHDFPDFIVWRKDDLPAYQLAVVVDDAAMRITEVVRGADLLPSTAQQLLLYEALDRRPPDFFHVPLVTDESGRRLAKRTGAHSLRSLRAAGADPVALRRAAGASTTGL
jgi:glutamyl-tRNA synthetase